ncbi:MAG: RluA family pseudouridine synthase [Candidatus Paceibacterales bacterium]
MDLQIIYEDNDVLVVDKPAGIVVFPEGQTTQKTLIDYLIEQYPELKSVGEAPRYGVVHRLDKDTSGILLAAKSTKALIFLQKQFKNREVGKKYIALGTGVIENEKGVIHTLIGRSKSDPRKQTAHSLEYKGKTGLREAISEYKVLERFKEYTLLEVQIKTGRKHQIRTHLAYIHHPIAGDTVYGFKDSPTPEGLTRQFLHACYVKITLPNGQIKEFHSDVPEELQKILNNLEKYVNHNRTI